MGYNAVLVVMNDCLREIEKDPDFGKKVADAIRAHEVRRHVQRPSVPGVSIISVQHADVAQIVSVSANGGRVIGYGHWTEDDDALIKGLERERRKKAKAARESGG